MLEETLKDRSYENKVDLYKREVSRLETEITSTQQSLLNEREYSYAGSKVRNCSCKFRTIEGASRYLFVESRC